MPRAAAQIKFPQQPYNLLRSRFPAPTALDTRSGLSDEGFDLLNRLLTLDPAKRITAKEAVTHKWCVNNSQAPDMPRLNCCAAVPTDSLPSSCSTAVLRLAFLAQLPVPKVRASMPHAVDRSHLRWQGMQCVDGFSVLCVTGLGRRRRRSPTR